MSDAINPDHYKRLPVEAIEIIESAIDKAPSNRDAYLHGQVLKYVLRCWNKNGTEDLKKAKWYLDRLIEHCDESLLDANKGLVKAWTCEDGKAKQVYPEQPQLPDGWRWLEVGEVIRKGDLRFKDGLLYTLEPIMIGKVCQEHWMPIVRKNRFEVGEKVVHVDDKEPIPYKIDEYIYSKDAYIVKYKDGHYMYHWIDLAPYIEETT